MGDITWKVSLKPWIIKHEIYKIGPIPLYPNIVYRI